MSKFYGIGVGPGNPEFLTIKATKVLALIDVLLVPITSKGKEGVAHRIAKPYMKDSLAIEYIDFPMVVDESVFVNAGHKAATAIKKHVEDGKNVGFITLGDASVYSTYGYIVKGLKALDPSVDIETIPGITSFSAAAAMANRPLVEKDEILSIIPMNASDEKIEKVLKCGDSFAFMKVYKREDRVIKHLQNNDLEENGILALKCGFEDQEVLPDVTKALEENESYLTVVLTRKGEK